MDGILYEKGKKATITSILLKNVHNMTQDLLLRYISGKASQQEKEEVATWIDADAANLKEFMSLRKGYDAFLWQKDTEKHNSKRTVVLLYPIMQKVLRIAAVFALAFGLNYMMIQMFQKESVEMQTVYVPAGQRTLVTLSDSTTIWVNGKSTLVFPNRFSSKTRNVELDGEAYFEVQKDSKRKFIVSTAHQSAIRVLGTKFNVRAYKEMEEVITTLVEGKVNFEFFDENQQLRHVAMTPGQKLVFHSQDRRVELSQTSGKQELLWKDGKIIFNQTSLRDALEILADRYNVEFVIHEDIPYDDLFSGIFTDKSLEQILNYIKVSSNICWRYLNNNENTGKEKMRIEIFI